LKSRNFSSDAEVIAAAETWMNGQISDLFLSNGLRSVLSFVGNMLKKSRQIRHRMGWLCHTFQLWLV